ncbi:MAG: cyclic nucleotide-binding domain-containing protein, partial [Candidatus Dadabacteria bacterium]|nr:cyclic nucleotide-binding domain-containing protein [Candidatus Dadabacteria bacterium]
TEFYIVENAEDFLKSNTDIAYHLAKTLAHRLNGVTTYLVDLKRQFAGSDNHFDMVDEVLQALIGNQDDEDIELGSDRDSDAD